MLAPDAAELVRRMIAERISSKLIRMLPPDSIFSAAALCPQPRPDQPAYIPERLGPGEIANVKFVPPEPTHTTTIARVQHLPRFREIYGDIQLAISLGRGDRCQDLSTT